MDQFKSLREREEAAGDGFQVVSHGKKNKRPIGHHGGTSGSDAISVAASAGMTTTKESKAAGVPQAKVPFHNPSIPRPQELYSIRVNNYNSPFNHVWLERSEDGTRPIHPLEKLPVEQFIDRNIPENEPVKPGDLDDTPFTLVEDKTGLLDLCRKLKSVNEFAVDLEHNQYRSFQGLTCLMQISTRTEDFIVDTLKLRIYIGLYLKDYFRDPTKRKIMHGADRDIMWLQRDFHIYVCNLFDTGQASKVLQMERNSLEHLLHQLCGVTANKVYKYQKADWRSRPLSNEMIKYAREDTHYLLYIYDLMRLRLHRESTCENDLLLEVQERSNVVCLQLYEKELLTDTSYLHIYGLQEHELDAKQLAVVCALHQWRDYIAREQDESTGYVLPNKALIEIAKKMPKTTTDLRRIVKSKYPFIEDKFDVILGIIWNAAENSSMFQEIAEQLKKERLDLLDLKSVLATSEVVEMAPVDDANVGSNSDPAKQYYVAPSSTAEVSITSNSRDRFMSGDNIQLQDNTQTIPASENKTFCTLPGLTRPRNEEVMRNNKHVQGTIQELKKPAPYGTPVGSSTSGIQMDYYGVSSNAQAENEAEKAKSSPSFYYPQLPEYSRGGGQSHHGFEGTCWPGSVSYHGFQSTNQISTGIRHSAAGNKEILPTQENSNFPQLPVTEVNTYTYQ